MEQRPYPTGHSEFAATATATATTATAEDAQPRTPWEREDASFPADLFASWMECMTHPADFFRRLDPDVPFARPLIFFLVFWILGSGLGAASSVAFMGDFYAWFYGAQGIDGPSAMWQLVGFFLSPFTGLVSLGFYVLFTHLGVVLFVRSGRPIGVTSRGLCYVAAPLVVNIVPLLGWVVSFFWTIWLAIIAVKHTHRTTGGRAFSAVVVPPLLASFLVGLLAVVVVVMAIAVMGAA
jgi:hypothetical protein